MNNSSSPINKSAPEPKPFTAQEGTRIKKRFITKRTLLWLGGLLLLLMCHLWFPNLSPGTKYDTYSTSLTGKKAFYLLMKKELSHVYRNDQSFSLRLNEMDTDYTICILGPTRYPKKGEWETLLDWVRRGGTLIIAAHAGSSKQLKIEDLDITVVKGSRRDDVREKITTELISSETQVRWISSASIKAPRATTLIATKGGVQAITQQHGRGRVVVIASDYIFTNESMFNDQSSLLALRLVEAGDYEDWFEVDEGLNLSNSPKAVGLLFEIPFRPVVIQMLVLMLLYCWWRHFRFGPIKPDAVQPRRNIVDHTNAVGMMYYRSQSGNAAVRAYFKQLIGQLKLRTHRGKEERVLAPIAARMQTTVEALMKRLSSTAQATRKSKLNRKSASEIIRHLAAIRQASVSQKKTK